MIQLTFDDYKPRGATYDPKLDGKRLGDQYKRVLELMLDGQWRTLREIENATHDPQASISARLRDIAHDGYVKDRRRRDEPTRGIWEYRITV